MSSKEFQNYLAEKITDRRQQLGVDQESVQDYADVSPVTLSNIEQAKGNPTIKTLVNILDYLGLELIIKAKER